MVRALKAKAEKLPVSMEARWGSRATILAVFKRVIFGIAILVFFAHGEMTLAAALEKDRTSCVAGFRRLISKFIFRSAVDEDWSRLTPDFGYENKSAGLPWEIQEADARYFTLGHEYGGIVYRVMPADLEKSAYVIKEYRLADQRKDDLKAFSALNGMVEKIDSAVQIPKFQIVGERSLRFPDIQGKDLKKVLSGDEVSPETKKYLRAEWARFVWGVISQSKGGKIQSDFMLDGTRHVHIVIGREPNTVDLYLKPDNAIVESGTGRVYLIDPF